jgi:hypothetical protein
MKGKTMIRQIATHPRTAAAATLIASLGLIACGSSASSSSTAATRTATAAAVAASPPGGSAPGGAPGGSAPGGGSSETLYTPVGAYTLGSGSATKSGQSYTATASNQSGVLVTKGATLTLRNPTVRTSGSSKSSNQSSFYGLSAGVLANSKGKAVISGGSVTTSGAGGNGVFAYGSGASAIIAGASIKATGQYAHGAMASGGGAIQLTNVTISTAGGSSAAVATDRGGGTISSTGGRWMTTGGTSPGIYSTGAIDVRNATITAKGSEGAVIEGANSITVTSSAITGSVKRGVMLYQSMSGDASAGTGSYTMTGGSLTASAGPAFYVTNTKAAITLQDGARVSASSGVLLKADAAGTGSGNTGAGKAAFAVRAESLTGNVIADSKSTIAASLASSSKLTGAIQNASLALDSSSRWIVTANSTLTSLSGAKISGSSITNITGNGRTVTYNSALSANSVLGGRTYSLARGGTLKPA